MCDLLAALNTGHDGGACTVHANSVREIPARMQALAGLGGMSPPTLQSQLAAAVQVVLHMHRDRAGRRALDAVGVVHRDADDGAVRVSPAWSRGDGAAPGRPALDALLRERGVGVPC